MSFFRAAFLLPVLAGLSVACGGTISTEQTSGTTGTGGKAGTTTSASTGTTTGTGTGGAGGGEGNPSDTYPAPFSGWPQVVTNGGPVLATPKFVPIFFSNDDATIVAQIEDFVAKVGATNYWAAGATEYGVGAGTGLAPVSLAETAPATIDDAAIQTWLAGKLNGTDTAWPATEPPADDNTVYVIFYPTGTTVTQSGTSSCTDFGGYHFDFALDGNHGNLPVSYAVVPRCENIDNMSGIVAVTATASHELMEAATDPYPSQNPAYSNVDEAHFYWERALGGGEVGDMCAQFDGAFTQFPELGYTVQRIWSNKAEAAGQDPCVPPLANEVYFNAAPELNDDITVTVQQQSITEKGVKIPVGMSKVVTLDLFSNASTGGPFVIHMDDLASLGTGNAPDLTFQVLDPTVTCPMGDPAGAVCVSGENGQKVRVNVTVAKAGKHNTESFFVVSQLAGDMNENLWVGLVGQ